MANIARLHRARKQTSVAQNRRHSSRSRCLANGLLLVFIIYDLDQPIPGDGSIT